MHNLYKFFFFKEKTPTFLKTKFKWESMQHSWFFFQIYPVYIMPSDTELKVYQLNLIRFDKMDKSLEYLQETVGTTW